MLGAGADGALPREFRIFLAGANPSTKGTAVFDAQAAADVMRQYEIEGNDQIVDRSHDSLSPERVQARADATDAMAWYKLAVRNGELWAIDVRWTPEGEDRLRSKKQRYISPAFLRDSKTCRICEVLNCALVSQPATHHATELIAAGKSLASRSKSMDPKMIQEALDALIAGDQAKCTDLLKAIVAAAAGAESTEAPEAPEAEALAETPDEPVAPATDPKQKEALDKVASALAKIGERVEALNKVEAERELKERQALTGELVKLGVEFPSTAWEGDPSKMVPAKRLQSEPIAELRSRVEIYRSCAPKRPEPPAQKETGEYMLTKEEEQLARGMTAVQLDKFKALRASRRAS